MLYLYIVRHGETEWNKEQRLQGRLDSSLTEKGREYARLLGKRLKDVDFKEIICSPSERTRVTAEIVRGNKTIPIKNDERIMEMHMGPWQGMKIKDIQEQYPIEYECFMKRPKVYHNDGAELYPDMFKRAEGFLQYLKNREINGNVLIVTHGLFIQTLYVIFKRMEWSDFWSESTVEGTSLTVVKIDEEKVEWVLQGDMSHIENIESSL